MHSVGARRSVSGPLAGGLEHVALRVCAGAGCTAGGLPPVGQLGRLSAVRGASPFSPSHPSYVLLRFGIQDRRMCLVGAGGVGEGRRQLAEVGRGRGGVLGRQSVLLYLVLSIGGMGRWGHGVCVASAHRLEGVLSAKNLRIYMGCLELLARTQDAAPASVRGLRRPHAA